jgi:hypothetical protein
MPVEPRSEYRIWLRGGFSFQGGFGANVKE